MPQVIFYEFRNEWGTFMIAGRKILQNFHKVVLLQNDNEIVFFALQDKLQLIQSEIFWIKF